MTFLSVLSWQGLESDSEDKARVTPVREKDRVPAVSLNSPGFAALVGKLTTTGAWGLQLWEGD